MTIISDFINAPGSDVKKNVIQQKTEKGVWIVPDNLEHAKQLQLWQHLHRSITIHNYTLYGHEVEISMLLNDLDPSDGPKR